MALTEPELAEMTAKVAARIVGTVLGKEVLRGGSVEVEIAGAAVIFCCDVAPDAPEAILREASIRLAGWIFGKPAPCRRGRIRRSERLLHKAAIQQ